MLIALTGAVSQLCCPLKSFPLFSVSQFRYPFENQPISLLFYFSFISNNPLICKLRVLEFKTVHSQQ